MKKIILILILLSLYMSTMSYGASFFEDNGLPAFQSIGKEKGLLDLSVSNIVEDKHGYIWFTTQGGLYKYNGNTCIAYRNDPFDTEGLIHNLIQTVYYDETEHALWLGTYQGVSKLDIASNTFTNYTVQENGLSNNVVIAIAKDRHGELWFGTMDGLNRLDLKIGQFIPYPVDGSVVRSLFLDSKDRLLVGTHEGLQIFDETTQQLKRVEMEAPSPYLMVIREFEEGVLTLGYWDGGVLETDSQFQVLNHYEYSDNRVYTVMRTKDDVLWTGTWGGGLFAQRDDRMYHFTDDGNSNGINHSVVYALFEDRLGNLWIGTNGNGAFQTNPAKKNYHLYSNEPDDPASLDSGKVNHIFVDPLDRLWIAVYNKGLNLLNPSGDGFIKYNHANTDSHYLMNDQVMDLHEYNGQLYIATGTGLATLNEEDMTFNRASSFLDDTILYALETSSDHKLWVGTYLDGVYLLDSELNQLKHFHNADTKNRLSDNLVYDIRVDSKNRTWIATNHGLNLYYPEQDLMVNFYKEAGNFEALPSNIIHCVLEDQNGSIWIGTSGGGISKYNDSSNTFTSITESNGLIDNSVVSILSSNDGQIWVATHRGISIVDPDTLTVTNLSAADGIGGENFTGQGYKDVNDNLYFGGTHGISQFPLRSFTNNAEKPPLYITEMLLYHTPIDDQLEFFNDQSFQLNSNNNYISFQFEALDFNKSLQLSYQYKLLGVDENWVESGKRRFVSYSNLKPGAYTFEVRARNFQGDYTDTESIRFIIEPPWYKTPYAYMLFACIILFVLYSIFKIRDSHFMHQQNSELAILNSKLENAVDELEKVSIRDPLTGIFNRRYFDTVLNDHIELAKRGNNYISLLMIDIDDFKLVNDQYGHILGDQFLTSFAKHLSSLLLRSTDFIARYGGDEFVIVLYDTDASGTANLVNRIFESIRTVEVLYESKTIVLDTAVSIGVCNMVPEPTASMKDYIAKADKALYEAKATGKSKAVYSS